MRCFFYSPTSRCQSSFKQKSNKTKRSCKLSSITLSPNFRLHCEHRCQCLPTQLLYHLPTFIQVTRRHCPLQQHHQIIAQKTVKSDQRISDCITAATSGNISKISQTLWLSLTAIDADMLMDFDYPCSGVPPHEQGT